MGRSLPRLVTWLLAVAVVLLVVSAFVSQVAAEKSLEEEIAAEIEAEAEEDDGVLTAVDEEEDHGHLLTAMPSPAALVDVAYVMPGRQDDDVVSLGKTIQTYVGLSNRDARAYRVTGVAGSLNRVEGFRLYVQNLTVTPFNRTVEPGSEASFSYAFSLNDRLDVRPYRLALTIFYQRASMAARNAPASARHSATFYNATISAVDNSSVVDSRTFAIGAVVVLGGIAAAVAAIRGSDSDGDAHAAAGTSTKNPVE
eukprot:contig_8754_g2058